MFDDDLFTEQVGEFLIWLLRCIATVLLVGIFAEFLISGFH